MSPEDVALAIAKEKLVGLPNNPGYHAALVPRRTGSRTGQLVMGGLATGMFALAYAAYTNIVTPWLAIVFVVLLIGLGLVDLLGMIGFAPAARPPRVFAGVIRAKAGTTDLEVLALDGEVHALTSSEDTFAALRVGDVGVAHVRDDAGDRDTTLLEFRRL